MQDMLLDTESIIVKKTLPLHLQNLWSTTEHKHERSDYSMRRGKGHSFLF